MAKTAEDVTGLPTVNNGGRDVQVFDWDDDAGKGLEGFSAQEQLIPFITVLQGLSPQLNPNKPEYVEGAQMGMLFDTATKEVLGNQLKIVPVWRDHQYTEWVPRNDVTYPDGRVIRGNSGGNGFRGIHGTLPSSPAGRALSEAVTKYGQSAQFRPIPFKNVETGEDTVLIDQWNLGVIYGYPDLTAETASRAMIAFTSTKIKAYKEFGTILSKIRYPSTRRPGVMLEPPLWAHVWILGVVSQSNNKGEFYNFTLRLNKGPKDPNHFAAINSTDPVYIYASEFYDQWAAGQIKADYAEDTGDSTVPQSNIDANDENIPF